MRFLIPVITVTLLASAGTALATHAWGPYHWARTSSPFTVKLGDNVSSAWDASLLGAANDWSQSYTALLGGDNVLDAVVVSGRSTRNCRPTSGRDEICNAKYGNNGWLGVAQIWITGGVHITQGVVKLNDTYFNTPAYNTSAWRNLVMCQEIGHTLGLDHQDENFNNPPLGTCMDYTSDPTLSQHPNTHDYDQLALIYAHLDSFTTLTQPTSGKNHMSTEDSTELGKAVKHDGRGRTSVFERDFGGGNKLFTFVFWAD